MIDRERLRQYAVEYDIFLESSMLEQFDCYARLLVDWNSRMNLTAITGAEDIVVKHFLDSILVLRVVDPAHGSTVIDVGTGAGFPGVPLKIVRPDLRLTLLDSLAKRVGFLQALTEAMGQDNCCIHGRAEQLAREQSHREQYDLSMARAVAALPALSEYCVPLVKVGGYFLAMKGHDVTEEVQSAHRAMQELGARVKRTQWLNLPGGVGRSVVVAEKISRTPPKYPRAATKITKSAL